MIFEKIKNALLLISLLIILFSPMLGIEIAFYISVCFVVVSAIYMMFKTNLTLKNDRIIVLFLISMFVAMSLSFLMRYFV